MAVLGRARYISVTEAPHNNKSNLNNFHSLEAVDRASEAQFQVAENFK